jgi:hypothetical protein
LKETDMAGVAATIELNIKAKQSGTADLGSPQFTALLEKLLEFTPGTAAVGQSNVLFSDERTLAASATEDLDVAGVLADALGATIAAAEVVAIAIVADAGNTNDVQLTRPAANGVPAFLAAGDGVAIGPGDIFLLTNRKGIGVTAATGDLLIHVANSGGTTGVTYKVIVIGRTVAA